MTKWFGMFGILGVFVLMALVTVIVIQQAWYLDQYLTLFSGDVRATFTFTQGLDLFTFRQIGHCLPPPKGTGLTYTFLTETVGLPSDTAHWITTFYITCALGNVSLGSNVQSQKPQHIGV